MRPSSFLLRKLSRVLLSPSNGLLLLFGTGTCFIILLRSPGRHLRRALGSPRHQYLVRVLLDMVLVDHLVNFFDHTHLFLDDLFEFFDLLRLLTLQYLSTWGLSKHGIFWSIVFHRCTMIRKWNWVFMHRWMTTDAVPPYRICWGSLDICRYRWRRLAPEWVETCAAHSYRPVHIV